MTILVVTAVSNGANLNDGMDGMCAGNSAIIGVALGILAYVSSHLQFAAYLNIMYIPQSEELVVFMCAFIGALIGFLWYNAYPAQVFMGDTGSLTIGGIIAVCAIIIHKELLLPILCGIFFVESLSVIIQVYYSSWVSGEASSNASSNARQFMIISVLPTTSLTLIVSIFLRLHTVLSMKPRLQYAFGLSQLSLQR